MRWGLIIIFLYLFSSYSSGQDPHFSQMYATPLHINPAMIGSSLEATLSLNYRAQWAQLPGEFATYQVGYEYANQKSPSSIAFAFLQDKAGATGAKYSQLQAIYAYNLRLGQSAGLKFGLQVAYGNRSLDYNQLVFGDQLGELGYLGSPSAEQGFPNLQINYLEVGAGAVFYAQDFWLGVSGLHLNQPTYNWGGGQEKLDRRISIQAGYKLVGGSRAKGATGEYKWAFIPAIHYSMQGNFKQLDVGANFNLRPLVLGLWYRGLPIVPNRYGAIVNTIGFKQGQFGFLYSYDWGLSKFARTTGGAHEISLQINLSNETGRRKLRRKKNVAQLPCMIY